MTEAVARDAKRRLEDLRKFDFWRKSQNVKTYRNLSVQSVQWCDVGFDIDNFDNCATELAWHSEALIKEHVRASIGSTNKPLRLPCQYEWQEIALLYHPQLQFQHNQAQVHKKQVHFHLLLHTDRVNEDAWTKHAHDLKNRYSFLVALSHNWRSFLCMQGWIRKSHSSRKASDSALYRISRFPIKNRDRAGIKCMTEQGQKLRSRNRELPVWPVQLPCDARFPGKEFHKVIMMGGVISTPWEL